MRSVPQSWQHLWQGEATKHAVLVSQSPLPAEGMSQMCQPSSTSSCMRCGLLGAWHSTGGSCTVPAAWPEVRLAQRLLSSVFVQPSTSPGCGAHQAGAVLGACALLRLSNATCWGRETSGTRSRNPGSREHGQEGRCGCWEHCVAPASQQDLAPILLRMPCRGGALPALPLPAL